MSTAPQCGDDSLDAPFSSPFVTWSAIKGVLSVTSLGAYIAASETAAAAKDVDPAEIDSFHHYLVSHLAYQIRDCFLRMGVKPPVAFRAAGWGKYRAFHEQKFLPQYENYWDATATIDSWDPSVV